MNIMIRAYQTSDLPDMIRIWNEVIEDGVAFPQEDFLNEQTGSAFFAEQTCTAVAADSDTGKVYVAMVALPDEKIDIGIPSTVENILSYGVILTTPSIMRDYIHNK